jgi:hypothetical protein
MNHSEAPWTDKQVLALKRRQADCTRHEYTCECGQVLEPTREGWRCPACPYTQNWCHEADTQPVRGDDM